MKMNSYSRREIAIKIAFISLVLLLSGSLFASGSMASEDCGMNSPQDMQSSGEISNLSTTCCGLGDAECLCHAQSSQPIEMPVVVLVSSGGLHSDSYSLTVALIKVFDGMFYPEEGPYFPSSKKAAAPPPLFLLNQSFII
jgi:hypothetical protein